jgi:hypothetical protein
MTDAQLLGMLHYPYSLLNIMNDKIKQSTISATALQREAGSVLRRVGIEREHIKVERDGFPVAVIIPLVDYELLMQDLSYKK